MDKRRVASYHRGDDAAWAGAADGAGEDDVMVTEQAGGSVRERLLPLLRVAAAQYRGRVPFGFPNIIDDPEQGLIGLQIDPDFALYVRDEDGQLTSEIYRRYSRTDNRSSAGWQKYGGQPYVDRRPLGRMVSDQGLRNLIAELMSYYNYQPGLLYITDD